MSSDRDPAWDIVHKYRRYSGLGLVPPVRCPSDQSEYVVKIGGDYTNPMPVLFCLQCRGKVIPGSHMLNQMMHNIAEVEKEMERGRME